MGVPVRCGRCGEEIERPGGVSPEVCPQCQAPLPRIAYEKTGSGRSNTPLARSSANKADPDWDETSELPALGPSTSRRPGSRGVPLLSADEGDVLPRRLKNYELLEEIGRGGMGVVYRARHVDLDRMVALKLIRRVAPQQEELLRFVVEAQVTGQIEHPCIVPIHEIGTDEKGRPFFVMKLVRGRALSEILLDLRRGEARTRREFPLSRLLNIFCEACQAVAFAHSKGVLHRDLKPANVMVGDFGEIQVMDWGLAKKFGAPETNTAGLLSIAPGTRPLRVRARGEEVKTVRENSRESELGFVSGTPEYMSPEQASGDAAARSPRSDVYSLGAILFEILAFRPPHVDADTRSLMRKVVTEPVVFPKRGGNRFKVSKPLRAVTLKALSPNPDLRYTSALALLLDVRAILDDRPVTARPDSLLDRAARTIRRHGAVLGTLAAALVVFSLGAAGVFWWTESVTSAKYRAESESKREKELRLDEFKERILAVDLARKATEARLLAETEKRAEQSRNIEQANRLSKAVPLYLYALDLAKRRQYDQAIKFLNGVIEIDPNSPITALAFFSRGEAYKSKDTQADARLAIESFKAADALAREHNQIGDPRALLHCGKLAWEVLQDVPLARQLYLKAAAADPQNPHSLLGEAYVHVLRGRELKDPAQVRKEAEQALALAQGAAGRGDFLWEAHYISGSIFGGLELPSSNLRDLAKAQQHFTQALRLEPQLADLWLGRAAVWREIGDKEAALSDYSAALGLRPNLLPALLGRGELKLDLGRLDQALSDLDRAAGLAPRDFSVHLQRGLALLALQRNPEAEQEFTTALALEPLSAAGRRHRALARFKLGRFAEAAQDAEKAYDLDRTNVPALQLCAEALLKAGRPDQAAGVYQRLLERVPDHADGLKGWADALRLQGHGKDALGKYLELLKRSPERQDVRLMAVQMLSENAAAAWHDPALALRLAREAEERASGRDPEVLLALAGALLAGKKQAEAKAMVERAYTLFPTDPRVQAERERLQQLADPQKRRP